MKIGFQYFLLVIVLSLSQELALAQSLNERLMAEDATTLAEQAREKGDIVRGAILFHQGNINCAKCHRPTSEKDRIGPDLSKIEETVKDEFVIESILQPSKVIKQGYETVVAVTLDGKVFSGLLVEEDETKVVIRDDQNIDRLITLSRDDIDEVRAGTKSSMPDNLANELKNRQQFLDLLRYVMDIRERGPQSADAQASMTNQRQLAPEMEGLIAIQNRNCTACHQSETLDATLKPKQAPNLNWSGKWLNPDYMARFIAEPSGTKPGTTMPHMLVHLSEAERAKTAHAITQYIANKSQNQFQPQAIDRQAVPRGRDLFHSVGCVACHSPRDDAANETATANTLSDSIALGDLSQKYNLDGLVNFLEDPRAVRPSGHMPQTPLTHFEAVDIASYLLQSQSEIPSWDNDSSLVETGKLLFKNLNCGTCHSQFENETATTSVALNKLRPDQGCLGESASNKQRPHFNLSDIERTQIVAALNNPSHELSNEQQIRLSMKALNCIACHDRAGFGGVTEDRSQYFATSNMNLGEQGRIPPTLTGVGAKLKSKWIRDVMVNARTIRPYMNTRMPQYGEENIGHLNGLFHVTDQLPETEFAKFEDQKKMREYGLKLAGNKGLNCVACHTYQYKQADTMPAVDLTEMFERLEKDWFHQYMLAPQKFSPNTVMPSFWPAGQAIRTDLEGDASYQVEALWQYLIDGRQARMPAGVVRKRLEIVVTNEAKMLRRSYPDIGKRGIGVGYPGGVNLAFDAEQMRLALLWKGKFADPGGVWTGQGSGQVRPMSPTIKFAKGPDLDIALEPWVVDEGRPPNHKFKGYELDEVQRPTFHYVFDDVTVHDFFQEIIDKGKRPSRLQRQVSFIAKSGRNDLRFRIATGEKITKSDDGSYLVDERLVVRILTEQSAAISIENKLQQLSFAPDLTADQPLQLVIEYEWK